MNSLNKLGVLCLIVTLLLGCDFEGTGTDESVIEFTPIDFTIASEGIQSDVTDRQILEAKNSNSFDEILLDIPSISGAAPNPNFETNQVVVLITNIDVCSNLKISEVSENNYTRLITATEVYSFNPGLCDPSEEAFGKFAYAMVEFERSAKPVSVIYKVRNDY
jgi:hypothetical protein